MLSLVKSLLTALPDKRGVVKTAGALVLLPSGEELGGALYDTCVKLIQHIMGQQPCLMSGTSPSSKEMQSKEVRTQTACNKTHSSQVGQCSLMERLEIRTSCLQ